MNDVAEKVKTDWSSVPTRLGSALVIASVVGVCLWFGGWVWAVAIALLGARAGFEWARMSFPEREKTTGALLLTGAVIAIILAVFFWREYAWSYVIGLAGASILLFFFAGNTIKPPQKRNWPILALSYLLLPLAAMIALRGSGVGFASEGFQLAAFIILVVIAADAGAYFSGKAIGGPKMAPKLSPNKTWAGFLGGLVLGGIVGGLLSNVWGGEFITGVPIACVVVCAAVAGDFLESGFKRHFGVKDTGTILPGHGGVLDRVDSHMAAFAVAALALWLMPALSPV